jgi:hypothetical protein
VIIGASHELGEFESEFTAAGCRFVPANVLGGIVTLLVTGLWACIVPLTVAPADIRATAGQPPEWNIKTPRLIRPNMTTIVTSTSMITTRAAAMGTTMTTLIRMDITDTLMR